MATAVEYLTWLHLPGVGPARALSGAAGGQVPASGLQLRAAAAAARATLERCERLGVHVIGYDDSLFPDALRRIPSPPAVLYVKGDVSALHAGRAAAVVGTRRPSTFGQTATVAFTEQLAAGGFTIVSGLAHGVDAIAHRTALACGALTVAVLGCGPDRAHPPDHQQLAEEIVSAGGAVICEHPPGTPVSAGRLVARNRLQSGLALAVCVMQAAADSGTMHTARFALAQGRPVLCPVPAGDHPLNEGLKLLTQADAGELPSACRAFSRAAALCEQHRGRPVARAVTRQQLPEVVSGLAQHRKSVLL